ncbi:MAG: adenine deaminase, partial [Lentisphaeria bacterium]|nr:adenine deaminase [Lentisphaeria bacterium]
GGKVLEKTFFSRKTDLSVPEHFFHTVKRAPITEKDLLIPATEKQTAVIGIRKNSIITDFLQEELEITSGVKSSCVERDILKIAVLERHGKNGNTGLGFVHGFALKKGAIASSVGHDSHNLCCVGTNDSDMVHALNTLIGMQGGFAAVLDGKVLAKLPLPVGGLLSASPAEEVNKALKELHQTLALLGCPLPDPFLALAFLSLPVIPFLKLTDRGMFDTVRFTLLEPEKHA